MLRTLTHPNICVVTLLLCLIFGMFVPHIPHICTIIVLFAHISPNIRPSGSFLVLIFAHNPHFQSPNIVHPSNSGPKDSFLVLGPFIFGPNNICVLKMWSRHKSPGGWPQSSKIKLKLSFKANIELISSFLNIFKRIGFKLLFLVTFILKNITSCIGAY